MTAQASNTGPLICRLILMPNDPLGQINSNNPHPCLSSLLARRRGEAAHTRAGLQVRGQHPTWVLMGDGWARCTRSDAKMAAEVMPPRRFVPRGTMLLVLSLCLSIAAALGERPPARGLCWLRELLPLHPSATSGRAHGHASAQGKLTNTHRGMKNHLGVGISAV